MWNAIIFEIPTSQISFDIQIQKTGLTNYAKVMNAKVMNTKMKNS